MEVFRLTNTQTYILNPLVDTANRPNFKTQATIASGDVVGWYYSGGAWNSANCSVSEVNAGGTYTGVYMATVTAAMLNGTAGYPVLIKFKDVAGGEWDNNCIVVNRDWADYFVNIKTKTDTIVSGIKKNTDLDNFEFMVRDATDHITPKTGLSITAQRSLDGGAYASCANSASEIGAGTYKINLAASDLNANIIMLKFTATGADARYIMIKTES